MSTRAARRLPVIDSVSAGGVVWRRDTDGAIEVVLGFQARDGRWGLPKGTPDKGEPLEATALREVTEETGLEVALGEKVGVIDYWFSQDGRRYHKHVHHWLMTPSGGDFAHRDHEYDDVVWVPAGEALTRITFATERTILEKALAILEPDA